MRRAWLALVVLGGCRYHLLGTVELDGGRLQSVPAPDAAADGAAPLAPDAPAPLPLDAPADTGVDLPVDVGPDGPNAGREVGMDAALDGPRRCADPDLPKLLVYYSFDDCLDPAPPRLNDMAVPGPADATRGPGTRCSPGRHGQALYFDGAPGAEVVVPERTSFKTTRMTLSLWVRPWRSREATVVGRWYYYDAFLLAYHPRDDGTGGDFAFFIGLPVANNELGESVSVRAPAEEDLWTHLAGTFDGQYVRLFKNGALFAEQKIPGGPRNMQDAHRPLTMGALLKGADVPENRFHGDLDEVRLYGVPLTPKQIAHLASCTP